MTFRVALVQAQPELGNVKANAAQVLEALEREDVDLVAFPEMFLSGYLVRDGLSQCAVSLDGPTVRELSSACDRVGRSLVVGAPRRAEARGVVHNSALLLRPGEPPAAYDKVYLPTFSVFEEDLYFREGSRTPVFDVRARDGARMRFGLSICYDLFFPEITKAMALKGADALLNVSASPTVSRRYFEAIFPARAIETTCYLLYTNLAGPQDALQFWGGAQAYGPRGDLAGRAPYDVAHTLRIDLDPAEVEEARRRRPALRDTRAEVLRELCRAAE